MENFKRFLQEVHYAYNNVPFYNKKLMGIGVTPEELNVANYFEKLPFTEKVDYRKNFPMGVLAEGFSLNHPMLNKSQSSGTTGERLVTYEIGMNLLQRAMSCAQINPSVFDVFSRPGRKICRYAAPNCSDVECANPNSGMSDRLLPDGTLVLPVYHDLLTTSEQLIERAIEEILEYQPDLFYVDPTHFAFLLREFKKRNVSPPIVPVMTSYSAATLVSQRQINEFFPEKAHFTELLSSSEMGWVAMRCPNGNLHLNEDSFYFELVNQEGHLAQKGELAELCISSMDQGAIPHLRYKTGDFVKLSDEVCSCGNKGRCIIMEGRLSNFITQNGLPKLSPQEIDSMIGSPDWLDLYQVEQISDKNFVFKIIVNDDYQKCSESFFIDELKEQLCTDIQVTVEVVDYIASERSGKFQAVKGLN